MYIAYPSLAKAYGIASIYDLTPPSLLLQTRNLDILPNIRKCVRCKIGALLLVFKIPYALRKARLSLFPADESADMELSHFRDVDGGNWH